MEWVRNGALSCGFISLYELDVEGGEGLFFFFLFCCGMVGMECGNMDGYAGLRFSMSHFIVSLLTYYLLVAPPVCVFFILFSHLPFVAAIYIIILCVIISHPPDCGYCFFWFWSWSWSLV